MPTSSDRTWSLVYVGGQEISWPSRLPPDTTGHSGVMTQDEHFEQGDTHMAGLMGKITQLARSEKGRQLTERAQRAARDPATKQKITDARQKLAKRRQESPRG